MNVTCRFSIYYARSITFMEYTFKAFALYNVPMHITYVFSQIKAGMFYFIPNYLSTEVKGRIA